MNDFYCDEKCVVSFFCGEFGWFLQRYQGFMRYLQQKIYPNRKFIIFTDIAFAPILSDFTSYIISLPDWFYEEGLDRDCYESVLPDSPPGSLTPPHIYGKLIQEIRNFYNKDKAIEIFTPRGCNFIMDQAPQSFGKLTSNLEVLDMDKEVISIFPRHRTRASDRNVPEYIWEEVIRSLIDRFIVVIHGTPATSCCVGMEHKNIVNLIGYNAPDMLEKQIAFLNKSVFSMSSQSGGTHLSLLAGTPSYIIGHERQRHTFDENRLKTPTCFRLVNDYRAIDVETILKDINEFYSKLIKKRDNQDKELNKEYVEVIDKDSEILKELYRWANQEKSL